MGKHEVLRGVAVMGAHPPSPADTELHPPGGRWDAQQEGRSTELDSVEGSEQSEGNRPHATLEATHVRPQRRVQMWGQRALEGTSGTAMCKRWVKEGTQETAWRAEKQGQSQKGEEGGVRGHQQLVQGKEVKSREVGGKPPGLGPEPFWPPKASQRGGRGRRVSRKGGSARRGGSRSVRQAT